MKLELNIAEDEELRKYVKDIILQQAMSIIRSELAEGLKQELMRIIASYSDKNIMEKTIKTQMVFAIEKILRVDHNVVSWDNRMIKPIVEAKLESIFATINLEAMIKNSIGNILAANIKSLIEIETKTKAT